MSAKERKRKSAQERKSRYRPKGVLGKGVSNNKNASEMRQKCVKNAPKWVLFFWEKRNVPKCVRNASNMGQKCAEHLGGEHLLDDTEEGRKRAQPLQTSRFGNSQHCGAFMQSLAKSGEVWRTKRNMHQRPPVTFTRATAKVSCIQTRGKGEVALGMWMVCRMCPSQVQERCHQALLVDNGSEKGTFGKESFQESPFSRD